MISGRIVARRAALYASISMLSLTLAAGAALAQSTDIGAVNVNGAGNGLPPITSDNAVGSKAPAGSAPALAPSQAPLSAFEPGSIVSDKVIRDMIPPSADYNDAVKYTPGFVSTNNNGLIGDNKGGWRGFQNGNYTISFDGIPFGDANNPSQHSGAYFPGAFLGSVVIDRGPGSASQVGYATFGGTMSLLSVPLEDSFGGSFTTSLGKFQTVATTATVQTGLIGSSGVKGMFQWYNASTDGALIGQTYTQKDYLAKVQAPLGDNFTLTVLSTYARENYIGGASATYAQWKANGKNYGAINLYNPTSQLFPAYNSSEKETDMEYIQVAGSVRNVRIDNKLYTYAYNYPQNQTNPIKTNSDTPGTIQTSQKIPTSTGGSFTVPLVGIGRTDTLGYLKYNDYRAFGDILKAEYDVDAGIASGTVRAGVWWEHVDNTRYQQYYDYTKQKNFNQLGNGNQASFKLDLSSHFTTYQPFIEYNWMPTSRLTITPGYKFIYFRRDHDALVNNTTLAPLLYAADYSTSLPYLSANYRVTNEVSVYAQASMGWLQPDVGAFYVFNPAKQNIKATTTTNYQAGMVFKNEKFTADVDVYRITAQHNYNNTQDAGGNYVEADAGTAQYQGIEAEGSYAIINGWSLYTSGALIGAKTIAGPYKSLRLGNAPSYTGVVGTIYDDGKFFGSLMQKFVGDQYGSGGQSYTTATNTGSLNHVKDYNTTDLVVGLRVNTAETFGVGKTATFKLGIYNVFNHKNITDIGGNGTISPANSTTATIASSSYTYSFLPGQIIFGQVGVNF